MRAKQFTSVTNRYSKEGRIKGGGATMKEINKSNSKNYKTLSHHVRVGKKEKPRHVWQVRVGQPHHTGED